MGIISVHSIVTSLEQNDAQYNLYIRTATVSQNIVHSQQNLRISSKIVYFHEITYNFLIVSLTSRNSTIGKETHPVFLQYRFLPEAVLLWNRQQSSNFLIR